MIFTIILLFIFIVPIPWEITWFIAWNQLNDRIKYNGPRPSEWVYAGPHFMQPLCAMRKKCRHGR